MRALAPSKPALRDKGADDPLSASEVAEMKEHFKFLRQHRKLLKLRLNATEDLLLNGVRDPVHRGVCQHLLAKVEKDRVLAVSERLPPAEAAKLLAGVLRFAPEVSYVLRYLECVSDARSQPEAAAALVHALRRIQFTETSSAQMRQVLALIVNVFPAAELPVLLFNWLYNGAFKQALDRSSEELPPELAQVAVPLRILHQVLNRDGRRPPDERQPELRAGVGLLLRAAPANLAELPERIRHRLFELGLGVGLSDEAELSGLMRVFDTLSWQRDQDKSDAALELARGRLEAGDEVRASKLLAEPWLVGESAAQAKRWLRSLRGARLGPIAVEERGAERPRRRPPAGPASLPPVELPSERWLMGFHVPTQTTVRFRSGAPETQADFARRVELWQGLLVPGLLRPSLHGVSRNVPFVAVPVVGKGLRSAGFDSAAPAELRQRLIEVCALLHAVAVQGVKLPDADARRFSLDARGRVWLTDLWGAEPSPSAEAARAHVASAFRWVEELFVLEPSSAPASMLELVAALEAGPRPRDARPRSANAKQPTEPAPANDDDEGAPGERGY